MAEAHCPVCTALLHVSRGEQAATSSTVCWTRGGRALGIRASSREGRFSSSQKVNFETFRASVKGCCSSQDKALFVIFWIFFFLSLLCKEGWPYLELSLFFFQCKRVVIEFQ